MRFGSFATKLMDSHGGGAMDESSDAMALAHSNEVERISALLEEQPRLLDSQDDHGYSLLHIAASRGHKELIELLVERGAKIDIRDSADHTPLHFAAFEGNTFCAKVLIEKGADIDAVNDERMIVLAQLIPVFLVGRRTALHYAAEQGHLETIKLLLAKGAKRDLKDLDGYSPFHLASLNKHPEIADLLNPVPTAPLLAISEEERMWRMCSDFTSRSKRAAVQYQHIVDGPCCFPCRHLERFLDPDRERASSSHHHDHDHDHEH